MVGRMVQPWFGGSASVWIVCLLFFQASLFAGYLYADISSRLLGFRFQLVIHGLLMIVTLGSLPIVARSTGPMWAAESPTAQILGLLVQSIGLPFLLLSANSPLLGRWWATLGEKNPYQLYAFSNAGSLAGLVSYPIVIEPLLGTRNQAYLWSSLFSLQLLLLAVGIYALWQQDVSAKKRLKSATAKLSPSRLFPWLLFPALGTTLLMSVSNFLTLDVSGVPLIWLAPLSLYLISFVLTFGKKSLYSRRYYFPLFITFSIFAAYFHLHATEISYVSLLGVYLPALFFGCMICHGELDRQKPIQDHITRFYLCVSGGGLIGGLFVSIVAPSFFFDYYELPLGFLGVTIAIVVLLSMSLDLRGQTLKQAALWGAMLLAVGLQISHWSSSLRRRSTGTVLSMERNFYGVLSLVADQDPRTGRFDYVSLVHGQTIHGGQYEAEDRQQTPTAYFSRRTGIGQLLSIGHLEPKQVGVIGLGVGTLAGYMNRDDKITFYEIDEAIIKIADRPFTFLRSAKERGVQVKVVPGDARRSLLTEKQNDFDILVVDAFSGDSIPAHLISVEAIKEYLRHLKQDGILAMHITNRYLDLRRVVWGLAKTMDLEALEFETLPEPLARQPQTRWVLLKRKQVTNQAWLQLAEEQHLVPPAKTILWTDDNHSLLRLLK